jgi:hypothetical protein
MSKLSVTIMIIYHGQNTSKVKVASACPALKEQYEIV